MKPIRTLLAVLLLAPLTALVAADAPAKTAGTKPNIIIILADDLGYGDVHCMDPQRGKIPTPHLDRLAQQGMTFTDLHSASSICTPSRYALLTGRYAWRTRLRRGVLGTQTAPLIAQERLTLPGMLKQQGYTTAAIGKWHLGGIEWPKGEDGTPDFSAPIKAGPTTRGFDSYFGSDNYCQPPYVMIRNEHCVELPTATMMAVEEQHKKYRAPMAWPGPRSPSYTFEAMLPTLSQEAVKLVAEQAKTGQPFFLYYALTSPHFPVAPSKEWQGKSGINPMADFIMETDGAVGDLLAALEKNGLADNTLVIFSADNGANDFEDYRALYEIGHKPSGPFGGYKFDIMEGGHRLALILRWPGKVKPGSVCKDTLCLSDIMATCADITGAKIPANAAEDSVSFLPVLLGTATGPMRKALVHQSGGGVLALREGKWKLVATPQFQLYDLAADIQERQNLAAQYPEIVQRLAAVLQQYIDNGRSTPGPKQDNDVPVPLQKEERPIRTFESYQFNNPNNESLKAQATPN